LLLAPVLQEPQEVAKRITNSRALDVLIRVFSVTRV
jgi:hypothetical protein